MLSIPFCWMSGTCKGSPTAFMDGILLYNLLHGPKKNERANRLTMNVCSKNHRRLPVRIDMTHRSIILLSLLGGNEVLEAAGTGFHGHRYLVNLYNKSRTIFVALKPYEAWLHTSLLGISVTAVI